jgi:hypothetical protein
VRFISSNGISDHGMDHNTESNCDQCDEKTVAKRIPEIRHPHSFPEIFQTPGAWQ